MRGSAANVAALLLAMLAGRPSGAQGAPLPQSVLAVRDRAGVFREFWSAVNAPVTWPRAILAARMAWRPAANGVEWGELELRGSGEAWRTRLIVAHMDPARVRLALDTAFTPGREAAWTLARASRAAVLAVNAGQFEATMPWGWVVLDGRHWLPPQHGPLSAALVQDSSGTLRWVRGDDVARVAATAKGVRWAFQSYPAILAGDTVPLPLRRAGLGIDVAHRDARAGICVTRDGQLLVALTRFAGAGRALHFIPFGLTVPEMAAVLGALGCQDAMLLDGGISARLLVRDKDGAAHIWEGLRTVPLGLVALPS
jgi:uncharacterized protein YigE (DUF2233 family)